MSEQVTIDGSLNLVLPYVELDYNFDGNFETKIAINPTDGSFSYSIDSSLLDASGNLSVRITSYDNTQGGFSWTPQASDVGKTFLVTLQADDSNGGLAQQTYQVYVHPEVGNHAPVITSEPARTLELPDQTTNPAVGNVGPVSLDLAVAPGATTVETISITLPATATDFTSDVVIIVDTSGSMGGELLWLKDMVPDLDAALNQAGITDNRFALVRYLNDATIVADNPSVQLTLIGSNNEIIKSIAVPTTSVRAAIDEFVLPADGDYTLVVGSSDLWNEDPNDVPVPQPYSFVIDQERDAAVVVSGMGGYQGTILAGEEATIAFEAPQGFQLYLDSLSGTSGNLVYQLESPSGDLLSLEPLTQGATAGSAHSDYGPILLSEAGAYTLRVKGNSATDTGNYNLQLVDINNSSTNLLLNSQTASTISGPKASQFYQFAGTAGQTVFYDTLSQKIYDYADPNYDFDSYQVMLMSPSGVNLFDSEETLFDVEDSDRGPLVLPESGDYTLIIASNDLDAVEFNFQLLDLQTAGTLITTDTAINDSLTPAEETNAYRFNVTAGDEFAFDLTSRTGSGNASWELIDPYGRSIFDSNLSSTTTSDQTPGILLSTGTYTLIIKGATANTGSVDYTFSLNTIGFTAPTPPTGTSQLFGDVVAGSLDNAGEQDVYLYTAAAGQQVFFDSLDAVPTDMNVTLISPSGHQIVFASFSSDNTLGDYFTGESGQTTWPVTLWEPGTYQVVIDSSPNQTGNYKFRFMDASVQPDVEFGTVISGTPGVVEEQHFYHISGQRGDRVTVQLDAFSDAAGFVDSVTVATSGGTEDGYNGIAGALSLPFRSGAAVNFILVTDENRDVVNASLTYNSILAQIEAIGATLHTTVMLDINADPAEGSFSQALDSGQVDPGGTISVRLHDYEAATEEIWVTVGDLELTDVPGFSSLVFDQSTGVLSGVIDSSLGYNSPSIEVDYNFDFIVDTSLTPAVTSDALGLTGELASDTAFYADTSTITLATNIVDASNITSTGATGFLVLDYQSASFVLSGAVETNFSEYSLGIEIDYDKDGTVDETFSTDTAGLFSGTLNSSLIPADGEFNVRLNDYEAIITYAWVTVAETAGFSELDLDDSTGILSGSVDLSQGFTDYLVEIDYDQNGTVDASLYADSVTGDFSFSLNSSQIGAAGSINVRVTDDDTQSLEWNSLDASALITFTGAGFASYSLKNSIGTLTGTVDLSLDADEYTVEIDYNMDGTIDDTVTADKQTGEFSLNVNQSLLQPGGTFELRLTTGYGNYTTSPVSENLYYVPLAPHPALTPLDNVGTEEEYVDLAFESGGTVWSLDLLRDGGLIASSFSNAFVSTLTNDIINQQDLDLLATDPTVEFRILSEQVQNGVATFTVEFTGSTEAHSFDLQFVRQGDPGLVYGSIPTTMQVGYLYDVNAIDADNDPLAYELTGETHGAFINPETGILTWHPEAIGDYQFTARVTDGSGGEDIQTWTVSVTESGVANIAPTIDAVANITTESEREISIQLTGADVDGDTLWYYLVDDTANGAPIPAGVTIEPTTGLISWSPSSLQEGTHTIKARVLDGFGGFDETNFTITVNTPVGFTNNRPVITSTAPEAAQEGVTFVYDLNAVDLDGDRLTYELSVAPEGMAIDPTTGLIGWIPQRDQIGFTTVIARVSDELGGVAVQSFSIQVSSVNAPPEISSRPTGPAGVNALWSYQVEASDPNGDVIIYRLDQASVNRGMTINSEGLLTWTAAATGDFRVEIRVDDQRGGTVTQQFILPVRDNAAPIFNSNPPAPAIVAEQYTYNVVVTDPNIADVITLTLDEASIARGMVLAGTTLTWTAQQLGDVSVTITAADGQGAETTQSFTLPVQAPVVASEPPLITSSPSGPAFEGQVWTYLITATDSDDDDSTLIYSLESPGVQPAVVEFNPATHTLTWTPSAADVGTSKSFTLRVTDPQGSWREQVFSVPAIAVPVQNDPPEITSIPTGPALLGETYEYQVTAFDPEGEQLIYSLDAVAQAVGVTIDTNTGLLTWANPGSVGGQAISITVTDEGSNQSTQSFTLPVVSNNQGPQITSVPVGPAYTNEIWQYQIVATDADNDALTYNLILPATPPATVNFNSTTNILSWTPLAGEQNRSFTFEVTDGNGGVFTQSFTIPAVRRNQAPEITSIPTGPAVEGELWTYTIGASDPDGDPLSYSLVTPQALPAGVAFDASAGTISWTPVSSQNPTGVSFTVRADDGFGGYFEQSFTIPVVSPPTPPVNGGTLPRITSAPSGPFYQNELWNYSVTYEELDGDPNITFDVQIDSATENISIDTLGNITWTPAAQGRHTITVSVNDNADGIATQTFDVDVLIHNLPPEITSTPTTNIRVNEYWSYLVQATDPNGDTLAYSLDQDSLNRGMTIDSTTGRLLWTANIVGEFPVEVTADDGFGLTAIQSFTVGVNNAAPEISSQPEGPAFVATQWSYQVAATDADGHTLQYELLSPAVLPDDMQIDSNGLLTWTPSTAAPVDIEIKVSDGLGASRTQSFTLTVEAIAPADDAPVIRSLPTNSTRANEVYRYQVDAYDPNGDPVDLTFETQPAGMTIDGNGLISWSPNVLGDYNVTIKAADPAGNFVTQTWTVTVLAPVQLNDPPQITSQPTGPAVRDRLYQYEATATDANGDTITWSLSPTMTIVGDMTIDPATGLFNWTPTEKGSYQIALIADDGTDSVIQTFTLSVLNNAPPLITSTPSQNVDINTSYSYSIVAEDPNAGDTLTITLENPPAGVSLTQTGNNAASLTWTPTLAGIHTITILATDQDGEVARQEYEVLVSDPNSNTAPQIISSPRSRILLEQEFLYQLQASDIDGDSLSWTLTTAPAGMSMDDQGLLRWTPTAADVDGSPHSYTVVVSDGIETDTATFSLEVTTSINNQRPEFTTNPTTNLIANQPYLYDADATDPENDTLLFSLIAAPAGMTINSETGLIQWTPTINELGEHNMTVRVLDTMGAGLDQTVTLTVRSVNRAPMLQGDPPTEGYTNKQYSYAVRATDPDGDTLSYSVSAQDANGNNITSITVDNNGLITWTPTTAGIYRLNVSVIDEHGLGAVKIFDVVVHDGTVVTQTSPPTIKSSPSPIASDAETYSYLVDARDPDGDAITLSLDSASIARGMTINPDNANEIIWTSPATIGQTYWTTLTATTIDGTATQNFAITVLAANTSPTVDAVPLATITAGTTYRYDIRVNDPDGDRITYTVLLAPDGLSVDQFGRVTWETTATTELQDYTVEVMVADGRGGQFLHQFTVRVQADTQVPTATILTNPQQGKVGEEIIISLSAYDNVQIDRIELRIDGQVIATNNGIARFTPSAVGTYHITATVWDTSGNEGTATPVDLLTIDPADQSPPTVTITSPTYNQEITGSIDIVGSVTDDTLTGLTWTLYATPLGEGETKTIATGTGAVNNAVLGQFDPTLLRNGTYSLELEATDSGGNVSLDTEIVRVDGNLKLGNFELSFIDMQVPVIGIPITVTRSYDTLNSDIQGDFGYGWSLDLSNTKVRIVQPDGSDPGLFGYPPFEDGTRIIITLPDGTEEGFTFLPERQVSGFIRTADYIPKFIADVGVKSELIVDTRYIRKLTNGYIDMETGRDYSPADPILGGAYTLILRNGVELAINAETGDLSTITDLSGNTITFTGMGIESDTGRSIQFERDYAGRITALIDPSGNRITYAYDPDGNLTSTTDRVGATTQFTYLNGTSDPEHYLDEIIDPLGRTIAKTEYDDTGRVIAINDIDGNKIEYLWNGNSKIQRITNPLGHVSIVENDSRGNVVRETDPTGVTTLRTFDDEDNMLTETQVIGLIDSVGNGQANDLTTTYQYNDEDDLTSVTDAHGNTTNTYFNEHGQPVSTVDSFGNSSFINYDNRGLPRSTRDALGNTTSYDFDSKGNITGITDRNGNLLGTNTYNTFGEIITEKSAFGLEKNFAYNINGDQIATWQLTTDATDTVQILDLTTYDANRRVTGTKHVVLPEHLAINDNFENATIDAQYLIWSTTTTFNLAGQITSQTDRNGFVAENMYDHRGQLIQTRQQGINESGNTAWTTSRTVYDAVGQVIAQTNRYVEGSTDPIQGSLTTYDKAGRVISSSSAKGLAVDLVGSGILIESVLTDPGTSITTNGTVHDDSGRVIESTNSYGLKSYTVYNSLGDVVETRQETYNVNGIKVVLTSRTVYDESGRAILSTGSYLPGETVYATHTIYDALGRAAEIDRLQGVQVGLIAGETSLDDAGAKLWSIKTNFNAQGQVSQRIDATGQITDYQYDTFGRQVATISPEVTIDGVALRHRIETIYDSLGRVETSRSNIKQFTDGTIDETAVQETSYNYDEFDNVIKTTFADPDGAGPLARPTTTATYDDFGRKTSETNQLGLTRTFIYNSVGQLTGVTLPTVDGITNGNISGTPQYTYTYDESGNQISITDPNGNQTLFTYDSRGLQLTRTLPDGSTEFFTYDDQSRQQTHTSFEGAVKEFVYDSLTGRVSAENYFSDTATYNNYISDPQANPPLETAQFTYDSFGRQKTIIDDRGTSTYSYNDLGQLIEETTPEGTIRRAYDIHGRLSILQLIDLADTNDPVFTETRYSYDALGRLADVHVVERNDLTVSELTSYAYDLVGNLDSTVAPNGVITDYEYDNLNRLDKLTHYQSDADNEDLSDNPVISSFDYEVRADGKRTSAVEGVDVDGNGTIDADETNNITWDYDELGRVISEAFDHYDDLLDQTLNFSYDITGNRLSQTKDKGNDGSIEETTTYSYDENDRLITESFDSTDDTKDKTTAYTFDATQEASKTVTNNVGAKTSQVANTYDLQGRLETVTTTQFAADGVTPTNIEAVTYDYSTEGLRTSKIVATDIDADGTAETIKQTSFLFDTSNHTGYAQSIQETVTVDGVLSKTIDYTYGLDEISQTVTEYDANGDVTTTETNFFTHDGHGSVRVFLNAVAAIVEVYSFDAYGNAIGFDPATAKTTLGYSGETFDSNIGQQYLRARYYNPNTGRFNRLDPFFGDLYAPQSFNKYAYTSGDPIRYADPTGLFEGLTGLIGGLSAGEIMVLGAIGGLGVFALSRPSFDLQFPAWPSWNLTWLFGTGAILAVEMTEELAEKIADHAWDDPDHREDLEDLGYLDVDTVADVIKDSIEDALAGDAGYLVKEGLERGRTAVRDLEDELVIIWGAATGTIFVPKNPDDYWDTKLK